jgi:hypothetical protein|tara:strand:- start:11940 stop:12128 length:189 start_codon:yes stop_codon:yes gene_type:complete
MYQKHILRSFQLFNLVPFDDQLSHSRYCYLASARSQYSLIDSLLHKFKQGSSFPPIVVLFGR